VGATLVPEILGQPASTGAKSPILNRYSLVPNNRMTASQNTMINTDRLNEIIITADWAEAATTNLAERLHIVVGWQTIS